MLVHVEIDVPILSRRHPNANNHVDTAGSKRHQNENWLGIRENALIGGNKLTQRAFDLLVILTIFHRDGPFYTTSVLLAVIHHRSAAQRAVGQIDHLIIGRDKDSIEDLNLAYRTGIRLKLDKVSNFVRTEKKNQKAAGEILQITRECHTNRQTGRSQKGCE